MLRLKNSKGLVVYNVDIFHIVRSIWLIHLMRRGKSVVKLVKIMKEAKFMVFHYWNVLRMLFGSFWYVVC